MSIFHKIIASIIFVILPLFASNLSQLIDDGYIVINTDNEEEYENILLQSIENPLIWQKIKSKDIENLPVNDFIKTSLIHFHKQHPKVNNWQEFRQLSGFSESEMATIQLFFTFHQRKMAKLQIYDYNSMTIEDTPLITKNTFRIKATTPGDWYYSGIAERDLDEKDLFDHYNFTVKSPVFRNQTEFLAGSFRFRWGNGLLFDSNPMKMISNSGSANLFKVSADFHNYSGSDENNYLFGVGNRRDYTNASFYTFYSNHNIDCRIEEKSVTSLTNTGYHVTETEIKYKNKLNSQTMGFASTLNIQRLNLGFLYYHQNYDYPLQFFDNQNSFSGFSLFHHYNKSGFNINGEIAISENKSYAVTESFHYRLQNLNFGMNFRYLKPDFHSIYGSILRAYGSWLQNEKGLYYYFGAKITKTIKFSLFADFFSRIEPVDDGELMEGGTNYGVFLKKNWKNKQYLEFKWSRKSDETNIKNTYNIKVTARILKNISLINRYIYTNFNSNKPKPYGQGYSSYFKYYNKKTAITLGSTYYFSNHSDCRIYIYEPGIPMKFNMASLSGTGQNYFFTLEKKVNLNTTIYFSSKMQTKQQEDKYSIQLQLLVAL